MTSTRRCTLLLAVLSLLMTGLFTVATERPAEAQSASTVELQWSLSADRSNAQPLSGATLPAGQDVAIFLATADSPVQRVSFFQDGRFVKTESQTPFDLLGTQSDGTAALAQFEEGQYHLAGLVSHWFPGNLRNR